MATKDAADIPIPEGWVLDIRPLGWEAWAHSPDGELGVSAMGMTKEEATEKLRERMNAWHERKRMA